MKKSFKSMVLISLLAATLILLSVKPFSKLPFRRTEKGLKEPISPSTLQYINDQSTLTYNEENDVPNCSSTLGATAEEDLAKIDSYKFDGIDKYIDELFLPMTGEPALPELPVFVTGFSDNHYSEGLTLLRNLKNTVWKRYTNLKLIIYDLGLKPTQLETFKNHNCNCEVRRFQYEKYPYHVNYLKNFAWKPLIVQTVAREHPLMIWMDASGRFKTCNVDEMFRDLKSKWLLVRSGLPGKRTGGLSERTSKIAFDFLHETPCTFAHQNEVAGNWIALFANQFVTKYILRPWVSCALKMECMAASPNPRMSQSCPKAKQPYMYSLCHRHDQSILGILVTHLFHRNLKDHIVSQEYVFIQRNAKDTPWQCDNTTSNSARKHA